MGYVKALGKRDVKEKKMGDRERSTVSKGC